jgi:ABC-2 type transport system permease protein
VGEESTTVQSSLTPAPSRGRGWWRGRLRRESNPLLIKELRGRMRGARAFVVLTVYLLLLSCFTSIIYYAYTLNISGPGGRSEMAYLGKTIFASVVLVEIFMVTFITPAFTAGAISGERERKTYELLRATLLPARKLVSGKLASALTYMFLLILAAVPLESLAFVLGGVVVEELALALVILLVTAFAFAVVGMFYSSLAHTTLVSTVLTYATALLATVGLPMLLFISAVLLVDPFIYGYGSSTLSWVWEAVLMYLVLFLAGLSPISAAVLTEVFLEQEDAVLYFWYDVGSAHRIPLPSTWIVFTVIYLALALLLLLVTVLRVRQQERW